MRKMCRMLQDLIDIDTSISSGTEMPAALCLSHFFGDSGIVAQIYEPLPGRGSVVAQIPGKERESILLLSHLDTADFCTGRGVSPGQCRLEGGRIYGRGALDCKGPAAVWAAILAKWGRSGQTPQKTILYAATAGEESGGEIGVGWLLEHTSVFDHVSLVLGEGGGYPVPLGDEWLYTLQVGESMPGKGAAAPIPMDIQHSAASEWVCTDTAARYIRNLPETGRRLLAAGVYQGARDMAAPLKKSAEVIRSSLRRHSSLYDVIPYVTPGYSDNRYFRQMGAPTLGFFPLHPANAISGIHGQGEYLTLPSLRLAYSCLGEILRAFAKGD